jgi:hypothetical protein
MPFPSDLHSATVFDSHMLCRFPAMPRICRSENDLSRPRQGRGRGRASELHGMCELASENCRVVAGSWQGCGRVVAGSWQGRGRVVAGSWQRDGMGTAWYV